MGTPLKPMGGKQNWLQSQDGGQSPASEHGISQSSGAPDTETGDSILRSPINQNKRKGVKKMLAESK